MMKQVVFCCVLAAAAGSLITPITPLVYSAPLLAPYYNNYRGPLSLAPGQPANILGVDGRPLDTLDVNLDRSAHLTAKALAGVQPIHLLKKRSVNLIAPVSPVAVATPLVAHAATPLTYSASLVAPHLAAPIAYTAPIPHYY